MSFNLATAKTRLGIVDPTKDALITGVIGAALALAETYCDRKFLEADEVEEVVPHHGFVIHLSRYPLSSVTSIKGLHGEVDINGVTFDPDWIIGGTPGTPGSGGTGGAGSTYNVIGFHMDKNSGLVYMHHYRTAHELTVTYHGGYAVLPADLELALWAIFDAIWLATPGGGAAVGAASGSSGDIERITIPDVGSISYRAAGGGGGAVGGVRGSAGFIDDVAAMILNLYRRESA